MRRIVIWALSTLTVLVLLLSYHTSRPPAVVTAEARPVVPTTSATTEPKDSSDSSDSSAPNDSSDSSDSSAPKDSSGSSASKTYAGEAVSTRFGNVQVQITVSDGRITASDVLQVPYEDRHDQMINSGAVPIYNDETVQQQSADIDVVSGATVTWEGYTQSLQSAIDAANL